MVADSDDPSSDRRAVRVAGTALAAGSALALVPAVSAHSGTVHAGTPHWVLLGVTLLGVGVSGGALYLSRGAWRDRSERTLAVALVGGALFVLGTVGLTELQVEPLATDATPVPREWYPVVALVAGAAILLASVNLGIWRWRRRPSYPALGVLLGGWVLYPTLAGATEYVDPVGYLLVLAVPPLVGYVLWRTARPALVATDPFSRRVGLAAAGLFVVFLLFSTGQFTLNPEEGVPRTAFVVVTRFANPLVLWPAVEFYLPSIPLFGALSVGTALVVATLTGLVGANAALAASVQRSDAALDGSRGVAGGLAATGATACCCCAPAFYGVASALVGVSASPLYWAFLDPASPFGALFFVASVALTTGSAVQLSSALADAGACELPRGDVRADGP